jgi:hypothetical protein
MAMRVAATPARCTIHWVPTSIAGEYSFALADTRHKGFLATVKTITSPEATIQPVATNRMEFLDNISKNADEVRKLLPMGRDDRHAVKLQMQTQMSDAQPCHS